MSRLIGKAALRGKAIQDVLVDLLKTKPTGELGAYRVYDKANKAMVDAKLPNSLVLSELSPSIGVEQTGISNDPNGIYQAIKQKQSGTLSPYTKVHDTSTTDGMVNTLGEDFLINSFIYGNPQKPIKSVLERAGVPHQIPSEQTTNIQEMKALAQYYNLLNPGAMQRHMSDKSWNRFKRWSGIPAYLLGLDSAFKPTPQEFY